MRRWTWLALLVCSASASAQTGGPFGDNPELDPIELARTVDALGDGVALEGLGAEPSVAAIRAAPYMAAPELALAPLVEIAAGHDPWLAPLAMVSVLEITDGPLLENMARREADTLTPVLEALETLAADEGARADLRAAAGLARGQLAQP